MTTIQTEARNATFEDLAILLQTQHAAKRDLIVPAAGVRALYGDMIVQDAAVDLVLNILGEPTEVPRKGTLRPTAVFDEGLADKLGIPVGYLKRLRAERPDIYDNNVNGWLHGTDEFPTDKREFMIRTFQAPDPEKGLDGIARAFLSSKYAIFDHFDILTAALGALQEADPTAKISSCDLSERRMHVKVVSPSVKAMAPTLLANYRTPFGEGGEQRAGWTLERAREVAGREGLGYDDGGEPVVFGGFVISNSETGGGAYTLVPRLEVQVCKNGLVIPVDALRKVHLGTKLDAGVIEWSHATMEKNLELVASQTADAVKTFLNVDYVQAKITEIEEAAGHKLDDPVETVKVVGKTLKLSEERTADVLRHFILGGQATAGGVMQAVTSVAQTVPDPDEANALEALALPALVAAAAA